MHCIDQLRSEFGVEPICAALTSADVKIAPSTYYAARGRTPSLRAVRDEAVKTAIRRVHVENHRVYGIGKVHAQLGREGGVAGLPVARCTTQRLMKDLGLRGIRRARRPRPTVLGPGAEVRPGVDDAQLRALGQDRLWVADVTYCRTSAGWVYAAFVIDVFSRRVVGWQLSTSLHVDLALNALDMARSTRARECHDTGTLGHGADLPVQRLAVRCTGRLAETGAIIAVGSRADDDDDDAAEAFNSRFQAELVRHQGPWKSIDDLATAVAEYLDWFNHRRLHSELGLIPPVEHENLHRVAIPAQRPADEDSSDTQERDS